MEYAWPVISCACTPLVMYLPAINLIQNRFLVLNQVLIITLQIIDAYMSLVSKEATKVLLGLKL